MGMQESGRYLVGIAVLGADDACECVNADILAIGLGLDYHSDRNIDWIVRVRVFRGAAETSSGDGRGIKIPHQQRPLLASSPRDCHILPTARYCVNCRIQCRDGNGSRPQSKAGRALDLANMACNRAVFTDAVHLGDDLSRTEKRLTTRE